MVVIVHKIYVIFEIYLGLKRSFILWFRLFFNRNRFATSFEVVFDLRM